MKKMILIFITFCMIFLPIYKASAQTNYTYAYINATELGPRTCPSTSCSRVISDENRTIWLYRPRVVEVIDYSGDWAKIRWNWYGFTYEGYILQKYLGNKKETILDENYKNELRRKGFPESYVDSLTKMHMIHPNWNFEVSNTNVSLDDATNNEYSPVYKNLINTSNKNQLSTDGAAYSNGNYIQFEPGWYAPNRETLKYYLDPRNFLDDNSIFMFEQLSYNSSVTQDDIQKILNGTFMQGTYTYNGQTRSYAETFLQAGKEYNVNPVHLAARVLQEQGTSGSSTSVMSYNNQNYYNYFNFNATGSSAAEIISNALNYAVKCGWNNPYLAIRGGASGISNGYISNGQDTIFYQKFNLVGGSRYSHQYMANIQAPYTESYETFKSYINASLVDTGFTFKIPVYSDMPKATVISTKSSNNNLSKLSVTNCDINPKFDSAITDYTCSVNDNVSKVDINASLADTKAKLEGTGSKTLSSDTNNYEIKVTAEDGKEKIYKITINKIKPLTSSPNEIISTLGLNNSNNNVSGFKIGLNITDVKKAITDNYTKSSVKITDSNNKEITSGIISTNQKITISNNNQTTTYVIIVKGDTNGDGKIGIGDYAKINDSILGKTKLDGAYNLAADTNNDGKIGIGDYAKVKDYILGKINNIE